MRYLLYARKSSESEDKQAQSIEDQLHDLRALAQQRNLTVVAELTEARSAKAPGSRPVFAEMIARLDGGEADAILCWHVNRLFRNPVDFGTISWMLQTGALREIHTPSQVHRSGDNVLLLSVENGMANQYILDLRKVVLRGLNSKIDKGWFPHKAPAGYRNADTVIEPDPERFVLVRKAWDLMLTGNCTPPQVLEIMTKDWGYVTRQTKKGGGTPLTRTSIYTLFGNIFYAGYFKRAGEIHSGSHVPMVTLEEFFRVQAILHKSRPTRQRVHNFAYSGLMECGHCGCSVVGDLKQRRLSDGTIKTYRYYVCSNARRNCTRKGITEEQVDTQIAAVMEKVSIPPELRELAEDVIRDWSVRETEFQSQAQTTLEKRIQEMERKKTKLLDLKLSELLSDAEYLEQKTRLGEELTDLQMEAQRAREQAADLENNLHRAVAFATYGATCFEGGEPALRSLIAKTLGARYVLVNKSLAIEINPALSPLCELSGQQNTPLNRDPSENGARQNAAETSSSSVLRDNSVPVRQVWWDTLDAIRNAILKNHVRLPSLDDMIAINQAKPAPPRRSQEWRKRHRKRAK